MADTLMASTPSETIERFWSAVFPERSAAAAWKASLAKLLLEASDSAEEAAGVADRHCRHVDPRVRAWEVEAHDKVCDGARGRWSLAEHRIEELQGAAGTSGGRPEVGEALEWWALAVEALPRPDQGCAWVYGLCITRVRSLAW